MPWFKVDDGLTSSRKWLSIPKKHRHEAVGVWAWAGSWSAKELTDGVIPKFMLEEWGVRKIIKDHLVSANLWSEDGANVAHLKWEEYQPTKAEVEADRRKNREKLRKWRERNHGENSDVTELQTSYEQDSNAAPDPTRPDPTYIKDSSSEVANATPRPEVESLLDLLDSQIQSNGLKKPARTKKNQDAIRLLLDRDGHRPDQVAWIIRWAAADEFWHSNILSASKLREKFPQLMAKAGVGNTPAAKASFSGDINPDTILGKDYWVPGTPPADLTMQEEIAWKNERTKEHRADRLAEAKRRVNNE